MKHTKGKLEVVIVGKYDSHKLCQQNDTTYRDILNDVLSEQAFANLDEIAHRWNAFEEGGLVSDLLAGCEIMLQEIKDNNYARFGINPGADDETKGAKLGRAAIAKSQT